MLWKATSARPRIEHRKWASVSDASHGVAEECSAGPWGSNALGSQAGATAATTWRACAPPSRPPSASASVSAPPPLTRARSGTTPTRRCDRHRPLASSRSLGSGPNRSRLAAALPHGGWPGTTRGLAGGVGGGGGFAQARDPRQAEAPRSDLGAIEVGKRVSVEAESGNARRRSETRSEATKSRVRRARERGSRECAATAARAAHAAHESAALRGTLRQLRTELAQLRRELQRAREQLDWWPRPLTKLLPLMLKPRRLTLALTAAICAIVCFKYGGPSGRRPLHLGAPRGE